MIDAVLQVLFLSYCDIQVSAAFAEAEQQGKVITVEDLNASSSPTKSTGSSVQSPEHSFKVSSHDDRDVDVPTKKMADLSLEARLKNRRKGTAPAAAKVTEDSHICLV